MAFRFSVKNSSINSSISVGAVTAVLFEQSGIDANHPACGESGYRTSSSAIETPPVHTYGKSYIDLGTSDRLDSLPCRSSSSVNPCLPISPWANGSRQNQGCVV